PTPHTPRAPPCHRSHCPSGRHEPPGPPRNTPRTPSPHTYNTPLHTRRPSQPEGGRQELGAGRSATPQQPTPAHNTTRRTPTEGNPQKGDLGVPLLRPLRLSG